MAYNITEEKLLEEMVRNPTWVLFYHRDKVKQLLPAMAEAYILIDRLQKEVKAQLEEKPNQSFICQGCRNPMLGRHHCHHWVGRHPKPCDCYGCDETTCECVECKERAHGS